MYRAVMEYVFIQRLLDVTYVYANSYFYFKKKFIPFNTSYNEHYNLDILYIFICSIIYLVEARIYIFSTNHAFHTVC